MLNLDSTGSSDTRPTDQWLQSRREIMDHDFNMREFYVFENPDSLGSLATCPCRWMVLSARRDIADHDSNIQRFHTPKIPDDSILTPALTSNTCSIEIND
jgi:hypothetical protein